MKTTSIFSDFCVPKMQISNNFLICKPKINEERVDTFQYSDCNKTMSQSLLQSNLLSSKECIKIGKKVGLKLYGKDDVPVIKLTEQGLHISAPQGYCDFPSYLIREDGSACIFNGLTGEKTELQSKGKYLKIINNVKKRL